MGEKLELAIGVLNGVVGDYLVKSRNGLATRMTISQRGERVGTRAVLFVHGLAATEHYWKVPDLGMTTLFLRYNSGRAIRDNGMELASLLERQPPVDELILVGHSMGGLVIRSACQAAREAGHRWLSTVRRAIYVGTPHAGAPMEKVGRIAARVLAAVPDPYTRLVADIGDLRSLGIKGLGDAHDAPLLPEIRHYFVAGKGDFLVPRASSTHGAAADCVQLVDAGHNALPGHPEVHEHIRRWCTDVA